MIILLCQFWNERHVFSLSPKSQERNVSNPGKKYPASEKKSCRGQTDEKSAQQFLTRGRQFQRSPIGRVNRCVGNTARTDPKLNPPTRPENILKNVPRPRSSGFRVAPQVFSMGMQTIVSPLFITQKGHSLKLVIELIGLATLTLSPFLRLTFKHDPRFKLILG